MEDLVVVFLQRRLDAKRRGKTNIEITEPTDWAAIFTITRTSLIALCLLIQFRCLFYFLISLERLRSVESFP